MLRVLTMIENKLARHYQAENLPEGHPVRVAIDELRRLRADAARYWWLAARMIHVAHPAGSGWTLDEVLVSGDRDLDEVIDAIAPLPPETPLYTTPPDHTAAMRQALEALEERYIGALRDNAIDALRAALGEK